MSACVPTYMLASSLIGGMNWSQAVLTIFLGNLIVVIRLILNAHAGTRYGIPFPVFCRASFGTVGANVRALMRAYIRTRNGVLERIIASGALRLLHPVEHVIARGDRQIIQLRNP